MYFEVGTLLHVGVSYLFKGIKKKKKHIKKVFISTGAVCAWPPVFGGLFPRWLLALHLLAHLLISQQSAVELGGSDDPVRSADPPAAGGIWHLQSGTLANLTQLFFNPFCLCLLTLVLHRFTTNHRILMISGKDRDLCKAEYDAEVSLHSALSSLCLYFWD